MSFLLRVLLGCAVLGLFVLTVNAAAVDHSFHPPAALTSASAVAIAPTSVTQTLATASALATASSLASSAAAAGSTQTSAAPQSFAGDLSSNAFGAVVGVGALLWASSQCAF
ncbi:hypothetical protein JCM8097_006714 [Rhodosporidiobolus ruineniae]